MKSVKNNQKTAGSIKLISSNEEDGEKVNSQRQVNEYGDDGGSEENNEGCNNNEDEESQEESEQQQPTTSSCSSQYSQLQSPKSQIE